MFVSFAVYKYCYQNYIIHSVIVTGNCGMLTYTAGDRDYRSTYGSVQPGFGYFAFNFGKESIQQVFGASSNEK